MTPIAPALLLAEVAYRQQQIAEDYRRANGGRHRRYRLRRPRNPDRVA